MNLKCKILPQYFKKIKEGAEEIKCEISGVELLKPRQAERIRINYIDIPLRRGSPFIALSLAKGWRAYNMTKADMICAIHDAVFWFENFGYNAYGIACDHDFPDHKQIETQLKEVLQTLQDKEYKVIYSESSQP